MRTFMSSDEEKTRRAMRHLIVSVAAVSLLATVASAQGPTGYTAIDLGTLGGLFTSSAATGINNRGEVVGYSYYVFSPPGGILIPSAEFRRGFVFDGVRHDFDQLGSPSAINDRGQILGGSSLTDLKNNGSLSTTPLVDPHSNWNLVWATDVNNSDQVAVNGSATHGVGLTIHALLFDKGKIQDIGEGLAAYGINSRGEVVGWSGHAFLYDGTTHDLGVLGTSDTNYSRSGANAINDKGQVTGFSTTSTTGVSDAFLYDGSMHDLGNLGGGTSDGLAINNRGQVVGDSVVMTATGYANHAFLYTSGVGMVDLNSLIDPASGWTLESATAINDSGEIAGNGLIDGQKHAFLLTPDHSHASTSITPVPEPASIFLYACGFLCLLACGAATRHRRIRAI
jgi:probable HAF family extracellular repeat protein